MMIISQSLKKGLEACLITRWSESTEVSFRFNRLRNIANTENVSHTLQVIKDGKTGVLNIAGFEPAQEHLDKVVELSEFGSPVNYSFPQPEQPPNPEMYHQDVVDLGLDTMIDRGSELVEFLRALDPAINASCSIAKSHYKKAIHNTKGLSASWSKTVVETVVGVELAQGQNLISIYDWYVSTGLDCNLDQMKAGIERNFNLSKKPVDIEPGSYHVVFTPSAFADLIHPIVACLDGKSVVRGISPLRGRLGEKVFSDKLTIVEDGTLKNGVGSALYDDQGVRCQRTFLVNAGVLSEYLLDLESAKALNRRPTGTGRISSISPNNLLVLPGDTPSSKMVSGMEKGIIIKETMGAWAGNPYSGQVTGNISLGFLVENGKPVGRIKDCMFSVNIFRDLQHNLLGLSQETQSKGYILPYALLSDVSISTKH